MMPLVIILFLLRKPLDTINFVEFVTGLIIIACVALVFFRNHEFWQ